MITNVKLVGLDFKETFLPVSHQSETLPRFLELRSLTDLYFRYYEISPLKEDGKTVYNQLPHKPSEPFKQD